MQGLKDKNFNPEELLEEQEKWQEKQPPEQPTQNPPKKQ